MSRDFFTILHDEPQVSLWLEGPFTDSVQVKILNLDPLSATIICTGDFPGELKSGFGARGSACLRVEGTKGHWRVPVCIQTFQATRNTLLLAIDGVAKESPQRNHFRLNNPGVKTSIRHRKPLGEESKFILTRTRNLSEGGVAVLVPPVDYQPGMVMEVMLQLDDGFIFSTRAKIVHIMEHSGEPGLHLLCLQFTQLHTQLRERLFRYLFQKDLSRRKLSR